MNAHDVDIDALREMYRDLSELDRRPEGIRYSATLSDGTPVVVLAIARSLAAGVQFPERFIATLERTASIHHAALAQPVAWGRTSRGMLHCAYPRLDVQEVAPGSLSAAAVATIGVQLARAVSVAHEAGLPHGAIATERISHTREHGALLNWFGLFAALCAGGVEVREAATRLCDAPYLSPEEQAGTTPDERSDVYSLGASLYELLTGKPPYGGRTTAFVMAGVLSDAEGASSDAAEDRMTGLVVEALLRAIEHAPDDRWPSATAFANALAIGVARSSGSPTEMSRARGCLPAGSALSAALMGGIIAVLVSR